ncbi:MAG: nitroreductase family protein [Candidatus Microthrix sp.]|nr:nitroreductase family protein [Candidatus Microthrix sp.]
MTRSGRTAKPEAAKFEIPSAEEALARLDMSLAEAMRTQRAVRKLHLDPVSHDVLLPLLELSLKAPTSSNSQDWSYLVVEDPEQKERLAKLYRPLFSAFDPVVTRLARGDGQALRQMAPGRWQAKHFAELPVFVIPCYRRSLKHRPVGRPQIAVSSFYGSVFPAVQNLLLECRAVGLGASIQTLPIWHIPSARRILGLPRKVNPVCIIPIGWPRGRYGPTTRRPIGEVVHLDRYGNQPFLHQQEDTE